MENRNITNQFTDYDLPIHGIRFPTFVIEDHHRKTANIADGGSNFDFLKELTMQGFSKRTNLKKGTPDYEIYTARIKRELDTYSELGFVDYILMVWDVVDHCNSNGIPVGRGRGSCVSSLVLYLIGVTQEDPIKYGLFFERFVSKARAKKKVVDGITYIDGKLAPDIDLDFCYRSRAKVIDYVYEKYKGKTSKILTVGTLSGKILMKDCGKIVGDKQEQEMIEVADMIPKIFGQVKDIESAYSEVKKFKEWCDKNRDVYEVALKLRGLNNHKGSHASGYVVSFGPIGDICPLELNSEKELTASYDMVWMNLLAVKLDLLGLRAATLVHDICGSLGIDKNTINIDDPLIYENLNNLRTPHGIFQIEADCNFGVNQTVKPKNIEHLTAIVSLGRPGALSFVDSYAEYVRTGASQPFHPFFEDVLKDTGGNVLFQEQVIKMAHKIGFSLDEGETLRRVVGKKLTKEVVEWKQKITDKIKENNLVPKIGELFWEVLEASSNYSFNKCLSGDTIIEKPNEQSDLICNIKTGDLIKSYDTSSKTDCFVEVKEVYKSRAILYEIELEDGRKVKCSLKHKFMCEDYVMRPLADILKLNLKMLTD